MNHTNTDILIFISDLGAGGAQRVVCKLATYWSELGRTVTIVTLSDPEYDFFTIPSNVVRETIGLQTVSTSFFTALVKNIRRIWRLRRVFFRVRPAVAIGFVAPSSVLLVAAAIAMDIRTIAAERNDPSKQTFGRTWDLLRDFAYQYVDRITVNSTGAGAILGKRFSSTEITITPNPIPSVHKGPVLELPGPVILFVGRLHPQKGVDYLLQAFSAINAPQWHLLIVGDGDQRTDLESMSKKLGIQAQTTFSGTVQDPTPYYRSAEIFALPSRHEGTPNALLEAMCYGLPVVISDSSSGPLDLVRENGAGIVTASGDVDGLAKALQLLINDRELRERLGKKGSNSMEKRRRQDQSYQLWDSALDFTK